MIVALYHKIITFCGRQRLESTTGAYGSRRPGTDLAAADAAARITLDLRVDRPLPPPAAMSAIIDRPAVDSSASTVPASRRSAFWIGPVLSVALIAAFIVQVFVAQRLITPWYVPIGGTMAALAAMWTIGRPIRWWRVLIVLGCVAIAGLEWAFVLAGSRLPQYAGPAAPGKALPPFQARLADGTEISEAWFRQGHPTALIFFQGRWCPFCMTQLRELEAHHSEFATVGATPVVVSIEDLETAQQTQRDFPHLVVMSDRDRELADAVDVINKGFGPEGQDSAAPTLLILDGNGTVQWLHRPTRFIARPSASDLAAEIARHIVRY